MSRGWIWKIYIKGKTMKKIITKGDVARNDYGLLMNLNLDCTTIEDYLEVLDEELCDKKIDNELVKL